MSDSGGFDPGTHRRTVRNRNEGAADGADPWVGPREMKVSSAKLRVMPQRCFSKEPSAHWEFMVRIEAGSHQHGWFVKMRKSGSKYRVYQLVPDGKGSWKKGDKLTHKTEAVRGGDGLVEVHLPYSSTRKQQPEQLPPPAFQGNGPMPIAVKIIEADRGGKAFAILGTIFGIASNAPFPGNVGVGMFGALLSLLSVFFDNDVELSFQGSAALGIGPGKYVFERGHFPSNDRSIAAVDMQVVFDVTGKPSSPTADMSLRQRHVNLDAAQFAVTLTAHVACPQSDDTKTATAAAAAAAKELVAMEDELHAQLLGKKAIKSRKREKKKELNALKQEVKRTKKALKEARDFGGDGSSDSAESSDSDTDSDSDDEPDDVRTKRVDKAELVVHGYAKVPAVVRGADGYVYVPFAVSLQRSNRAARAKDINSATNVVVCSGAMLQQLQCFLTSTGDGVPEKWVDAAEVVFTPDKIKDTTVHATGSVHDELPAQLRDGLIGLATAALGAAHEVAGYLMAVLDLLRTYIPQDGHGPPALPMTKIPIAWNGENESAPTTVLAPPPPERAPSRRMPTWDTHDRLFHQSIALTSRGHFTA